MPLNNRQFLVTHFLYPMAALVIFSIAIVAGDWDRRLADFFYSIQGGSWAVKNSWLAESFFHKGGRALSLLFALILLCLVIASHFNQILRADQKPLLYLLLAAAGGSLLISILKSSLAVSCPWEFSRYGGDLLYSNVIDQFVLRNGAGCFPAGHASAGYAWVACYFFGLHYQSPWRRLGLILPLLVGLVFGLVQQLRGAHFLSHDLWALAVCWFYSLLLFVVFFKTPRKVEVREVLLCQ